MQFLPSIHCKSLSPPSEPYRCLQHLLVDAGQKATHPATKTETAAEQAPAHTCMALGLRGHAPKGFLYGS